MDLVVAITDYRNLQVAIRDARKRLGRSISADRATGVPLVAICRLTDFTREYVYKLQKEAEKTEEETS